DRVLPPARPADRGRRRRFAGRGVQPHRGSDLAGEGGRLIAVRTGPVRARGPAGTRSFVRDRLRNSLIYGSQHHPHPTRPARRSTPGVRLTRAAVPLKRATLTPLKGRAGAPAIPAGAG